MKLYAKVRLLSNEYIEKGAKINDIGYIIEIYDTGECEVEFSDGNTGISYAQIVTKPEELETLD
jgi:hypothetical protein